MDVHVSTLSIEEDLVGLVTHRLKHVLHVCDCNIQLYWMCHIMPRTHYENVRVEEGLVGVKLLLRIYDKKDNCYLLALASLSLSSLSLSLSSLSLPVSLPVSLSSLCLSLCFSSPQVMNIVYQ